MLLDNPVTLLLTLLTLTAEIASLLWIVLLATIGTFTTTSSVAFKGTDVVGVTVIVLTVSCTESLGGAVDASTTFTEGFVLTTGTATAFVLILD